MCLIITAIAFVLCYILNKRSYSDFKSLLTVILGSSALMWTVDCTFALVNDGEFFDLSLDDTYLGLSVVLVALVFTSLVAAIKKVVALKAIKLNSQKLY